MLAIDEIVSGIRSCRASGYLVSRFAIDEAVERIKDDTIND